MRAAVITVSSSRAARAGEDQSGEHLAAFARRLGAETVERELIADQRRLIEEAIRRWADVERCALVLTTGGTGLAPSDVTPEATRSVIERDVPGIAEAMRWISRDYTPNWMLSRAVAGVRGSSLIVNFPGNPDSIAQTAETLAGPLAHAVELIGGGSVEH